MLFVSQCLKDVSSTKKERSGVEYLAAFWPKFEAATGATKDNDTGQFEKVRAKFDLDFSSTQPLRSFVGASGEPAKLETGGVLMGAVADGSGLTLDPDLDSFYVMLPVTQDIPALLEAAEQVETAAALPLQDATRIPRLAEAFQSMRMANKNVADHLQAGMNGNTEGLTKKALGDATAGLKKATDALLSHKAALLAGAGTDTLAADNNALEAAATSAWHASHAEFGRLLQARKDNLMHSLPATSADADSTTTGVGLLPRRRVRKTSWPLMSGRPRSSNTTSYSPLRAISMPSSPRPVISMVKPSAFSRSSTLRAAARSSSINSTRILDSSGVLLWGSIKKRAGLAL